MSHITQRQLHWLCGKITTTGSAWIRCAAVEAAVTEPGAEMDTRVLIARVPVARERDRPALEFLAIELPMNQLAGRPCAGADDGAGAGFEEFCEIPSHLSQILNAI